MTYEEQKLKRLERFESVVWSVLDTLKTAIAWVWAIVILGVTALLYFKPLPQESTQQAGFFLFCSLFLFIVSILWRAVAKAEGARG